MRRRYDIIALDIIVLDVIALVLIALKKRTALNESMPCFRGGKSRKYKNRKIYVKQKGGL